jgi:predicted nucleic acid-binding protein
MLITPPDLFDLAAEFYNICRANGIAPEAIDMTICAAANVQGTPIFTTDPDFPRYAAHLPITLHKI